MNIVFLVPHHQIEHLLFPVCLRMVKYHHLRTKLVSSYSQMIFFGRVYAPMQNEQLNFIFQTFFKELYYMCGIFQVLISNAFGAIVVLFDGVKPSVGSYIYFLYILLIQRRIEVGSIDTAFALGT